MVVPRPIGVAFTGGTCAGSLLRQLSVLKLKLHFCDFVFLNMYVMLGKFHLCHSLVGFPFLRLHNILLYHTFHAVSGAYSVFFFIIIIIVECIHCACHP